MTNTAKTRRLRAFCALLALSLFFSLLPPLPARAATSAAVDAVEKLDEWGVIKGYPGGETYPDRPVTRAEFVAMVNRAYGFTDQSNSKSFSDVPPGAWYAEDIAIASSAGYFNGTSPNTASPSSPLSREDAMVLLAKCMRLKRIPGEVTEFTDGRNFGSWSTGYVKAAVKQGIAKGYGDGAFRPKQSITRGEMSQLLVRALGTLVNGGGEQTLGEHYGNVTVNKPGTVLKDTIIAGNLYVTGGLGTGAITLDNVTVTGEIIVAGTGASEKGEDSVILHNVEAAALVLDTPNGQYSSLLANGDTTIQNATLKTSGFLNDRTEEGYGFLNLSLEGRTEEPSFSLSGNLEDVVNRTPGSTLTVSDAAARSLTIDETAVESLLDLKNDAVVRQLNLDAPTEVAGTGDVQSIQINAAGSTVSMLPDKIEIRPGLNANVNKKDMDAKAAKESSEDPRLLAFYPKVLDIAPASFTAVFETNKPGTVYWAVSPVSAGSIKETELLRPLVYGSKAVRQGSTSVKLANSEVETKINGLTKGGSYYLAAILVDERGNRSPIKVVNFSTPDDTVPNFASGFPYMSKVTNNAGQVAVMTTKSCDLYYALLPKGAVAPTANDFRTSSIPGNLGYGKRSMTKSVAEYFYVEYPRERLEELQDYDLYLWLTDSDFTKSSAVRKLSFKTVDMTPPVFITDLTLLSPRPTALDCTATVNEDATIYWVAVPAGTQYPKPQNGESEPPKLSSYDAKLAVVNGRGIGANGKAGRTNARQDVDTKVNVSGLKGETAYDIYYLAQDKAGNYSEVVQVLYDVHTLDRTPPTATQRFDHIFENNESTPYADTNIDIVFSETVLENTEPYYNLLELYQDVVNAPTPAQETAARVQLASVLERTIQFYTSTSYDPIPTRKYDATTGEPTSDDWVIDYRNAVVEMDDQDPEGKRMLVRFYSDDDFDHYRALKLKSGSTYHFEIRGLADSSDNRNRMSDTSLPNFTTISAQARLRPLNFLEPQPTTEGTSLSVNDIDFAFSMEPVSASTVESNINWDMLLWFNETVRIDLYYREPGQERFSKAEVDWQIPPASGYRGVSLWRGLMEALQNPQLNQLEDGQEYEYIVHISRLGDSDEVDEDGLSTRDSWTGEVDMRAQIVTGSNNDLQFQAGSLTSYQLTQGVTDISTPKDFELRKLFTDKTAPKFNSNFPKISTTDRTAQIQVQLNRPGTVYTVIAPAGDIRTLGKYPDRQEIFYDNGEVPESIQGLLSPNQEFPLSEPSNIAIVNAKDYFDTTSAESQVVIPPPKSVQRNVNYIDVKNLIPNTEYFLYVVLQGEQGGAISPQTLLYKFKTQEEDPFYIKLELTNPIVSILPSKEATVNYMLVPYEGSSLEDTQLMDSIRDHLADGVDDSLVDEMTVLDAMNTDVSVGNVSQGSVFDLYADPAFKNEMDGYIRRGDLGAANIVGGKSGVNITNGDLPVDCTELGQLSEGVRYAFLVSGRVLGDPASTPVFRSIYPVYLSGGVAPMVLTINPSRFSEDDVNREFTVSFDKPLYYYNGETDPPTKMAIDRGPLGLVTRRDDFRSVRDILQTESDLSVLTDKNQVNRTTTILEIEIDRLRDGAQLTFDRNLSDEYGHNRAIPPLQFFLQEVVDENGETFYDVKIPPEWDQYGRYSN